MLGWPNPPGSDRSRTPLRNRASCRPPWFSDHFAGITDKSEPAIPPRKGFYVRAFYVAEWLDLKKQLHPVRIRFCTQRLHCLRRGALIAYSQFGRIFMM